MINRSPRPAARLQPVRTGLKVKAPPGSCSSQQQNGPGPLSFASSKWTGNIEKPCGFVVYSSLEKNDAL